MDGAHWVGEDGFNELIIDRISPFRFVRGWLLKMPGYLLRHRLPDRSFTDVFQIADGIVHYAVSKGAHFLPILRVKCFEMVRRIHLFSFIILKVGLPALTI
jgi:hypothetical protein